jgi:hypothetical protein
MESSTTSTVSKRVTDSWRELGRMHASQVLMVLGSAVAVFAGIVVYILRAVSEASPAVVSAQALWLFVFGLLGLIGYAVSRASLRNGAIVSGVAGLALLIVAGGSAGFLTGVVVLLGAAWAFVRSL